MRFTALSLSIALLAHPPSLSAFAPTSNKIPSATSLASTLAPEPPAKNGFGDGENDNKEMDGMSIHIRKKKVIEILPNTEEPIPSSTSSISKVEQRGPLAMTFEELSLALGGAARAQLVWDCYKQGIDPAHMYGSVIDLGYDDYESIINILPSARRTQRLSLGALDKLRKLYKDSHGGQTNRSVSNVEGGLATLLLLSRTSDGTTKFVLKLVDGLEVEAVIIPWKGKSSTLCISSQAGCRKEFAAGKVGKLRNLTADEILSQMFFAQKLCRFEKLPAISNIVFTGMGEPCENSSNVAQAAKILTTKDLFGLTASKVTVSTAAPTPGCFIEFTQAPCVLAWNFHAVRDELRKNLVPTTELSMSELRQGLIDALLTRPIDDRTCILEVALMRDVNDRIEHADDLIEFIESIVGQVPGIKTQVNLIPFNEIGQSPYQKSLAEDMIAFQKHLQSKGVNTNVRSRIGDDMTSAYEQLATKKTKSSSTRKMP